MPKSYKIQVGGIASSTAYWCVGHRQYLPLTAFTINKQTGKPYLYCTQCRKQRELARRMKMRRSK